MKAAATSSDATKSTVNSIVVWLFNRILWECQWWFRWENLILLHLPLSCFCSYNSSFFIKKKKKGKKRLLIAVSFPNFFFFLKNKLAVKAAVRTEWAATKCLTIGKCHYSEGEIWHLVLVLKLIKEKRGKHPCTSLFTAGASEGDN